MVLLLAVCSVTLIFSLDSMFQELAGSEPSQDNPNSTERSGRAVVEKNSGLGGPGEEEGTDTQLLSLAPSQRAFALSLSGSALLRAQDLAAWWPVLLSCTLRLQSWESTLEHYPQKSVLACHRWMPTFLAQGYTQLT